jgi:hypothetical protein
MSDHPANDEMIAVQVRLNTARMALRDVIVHVALDDKDLLSDVMVAAALCERALATVRRRLHEIGD